MILEINGRLEIGRKFFSSLGSRLGFLRRGKMTALLKTWGNKPELRDEFISAVSDDSQVFPAEVEWGWGRENMF